MADPTLYLYTSLTAGSSHIITATSRLETILKANKIPFRALDCATDEKARTLWGRRSKDRKLPGLVKFGQVIGDLEQVEEWNEFGELHEQIESVDDFFDSSAAPANPNTINLRPEPGPGVANQLTPIQPAPGGIKRDGKPISVTSSRASSQNRHISISEPTALEREGRSPIATPSENPMTMTMRQLGAEAAARAKDRKTSGTAPKPATDSTPSVKPDLKPSPPPEIPVGKQREASDPALEPEVTAAMTPAQLAAEGAKRTSVDKIDAAAVAAGDTATSSTKEADTGPSSTSTEEQVLALRRESTQTAVPSKLAQSVSAEPDSDTAKVADPTPAATKDAKVDSGVEPPVAEALTEKLPEKGATSSLPPTSEPSQPSATSEKLASPSSASQKHLPDTASALASIDSDIPIAGSKPRSHRGSSVEEADRAEIKRIEDSLKIEEDPEEDESALDTTDASVADKASSAAKPQET